MRQIVGIGETIIDIIFRDNRPVSANAGGSTFNTFISLGRMHMNAFFVSQVGNDRLGRMACDFLRANNISDCYVNLRSGVKTPVALAFLDKNNDAEYAFYKDAQKQLPEFSCPDMHEDDIFVFGSYFALNKDFRVGMNRLLQQAVNAQSIVYYDPNFRPSHLAELPQLLPVIEQNFASADVVRGSDEDFFFIYGEKDVRKIYKKISAYCPNLIVTCGEDGVYVCTPMFCKHYESPSVEVKSTVGAGDNFNAGFIYGLNKYNITKKVLPLLPENKWDDLVRCAMAFSSNVCCSLENYISHEFAENFK